MSEYGIEINKQYECEFPFVIVEQDHEMSRWKPGIIHDGDGWGEDWYWAKGMGKLLLTAVDIHVLPRPYHKRVFFIRKWIDPDGNELGKKTLRIATIPSFKRMMKGWSGSEIYDIEIQEPTDAERKALNEWHKIYHRNLKDAA